MKDTRKSTAQTRKLLKKLLTLYPSQAALSRASAYSVSYICYLRSGDRIASVNFLEWVKYSHPELQRLCKTVQRSKYIL